MNIEQHLARRSRINGRYTIKGRVGNGWEGVTYRVLDRLDGRLKAVKFITNDRRRKSLLNEARVLVRLQHPNIIDYYSVDQLELEGKIHYFLLVEYLQGPRLSDVVARHFRRSRKPPLFFGLRIFYQICRGMAYVHDRRLLHDDLHAENIILTGDPEAPVPKLFDFWGSRSGRRAERRAFDLRCAGQVLFEIMTGQLDYRPQDLGRLPGEVAAVIRKAHARIHKYRTFHEILADLEALRDWD